MQESPDLSDFAGRVSDSGEGRWTSIAAIDEGVPAPVLTTALYERFASRGLDDFADKVFRRCASSSAATTRSRAREAARPMADELEVVADEKDAARARRRADRRGGQRRGGRARLLRAGDQRRPHPLGDAGDPQRIEEMPWAETSLFQVDERVASPGSEDRNLTHIVLGLSMEHQSAMRPMPVTQRDLGPRPAITKLAARPPRPGPPRSRPRWPHRLAGPRRSRPRGQRPPRRHHRDRLPGPPPHDPHLPGAGRPANLWLVTGADKREALAKLLAGDHSIPAGRVENEDMVIVADEAAAPGCPRSTALPSI